MDNRNIAQAVLETSLDVVMKQRQNQHGDAENSFQMIGELWATYLKSTALMRTEFTVTGADVAHMMSLLKIARSVHGNGSNMDHYVDACGYQALAAMLSKAEVPASNLTQGDLSDMIQGVEPMETPLLSTMTELFADAQQERTAGIRDLQDQVFQLFPEETCEAVGGVKASQQHKAARDGEWVYPAKRPFVETNDREDEGDLFTKYDLEGRN